MHLLPGARQGTLEPEEDGGAGDAGFARPQARAGDAHEAGVGERHALALDQGAPLCGDKAMRDERSQIGGEIGLAQSVSGTGDAHQHKRAQTIDIEHAG